MWTTGVNPGGFEQVSTCFPPEEVAGWLPASGGINTLPDHCAACEYRATAANHMIFLTVREHSGGVTWEK